MRRLVLVIEYQGTHYAGFQIQPGRRTIQGELETAIETIVGEHVKTYGAGRTDAGTHAHGQVVAFDTSSMYDIDVFGRGINSKLPGDIRVISVYQMESGFDPRRSAHSRRYRYVVLNRTNPSALWKDFSYHVAKPMDDQSMNAAAELLKGAHRHPPFSNPKVKPSHPQVIQSATVQRMEDWIVLEIEATSFYLHQVRRIAGALVGIGLHRISIEDFRSLMENDYNSGAAPVLPAKGLYLANVSYSMALDKMDVSEKRKIANDY